MRSPGIYKSEVPMLPQSFSAYLLPILLLVGSNIFMTTAWYWHLRFKEVPLFRVIKLGARLRRILPGGSGQSVRQRRIFPGAAQDDALIAAGGFFVFCRPLSYAAA